MQPKPECAQVPGYRSTEDDNTAKRRLSGVLRTGAKRQTPTLPEGGSNDPTRFQTERSTQQRTKSSQPPPVTNFRGQKSCRKQLKSTREDLVGEHAWAKCAHVHEKDAKEVEGI